MRVISVSFIVVNKPVKALENGSTKKNSFEPTSVFKISIGTGYHVKGYFRIGYLSPLLALLSIIWTGDSCSVRLPGKWFARRGSMTNVLFILLPAVNLSEYTYGIW